MRASPSWGRGWTQDGARGYRGEVEVAPRLSLSMPLSVYTSQGMYTVFWAFPVVTAPRVSRMITGNRHGLRPGLTGIMGPGTTADQEAPLELRAAHPPDAGRALARRHP